MANEHGYVIRKANGEVPFDGDWDAAAWQHAGVIDVDHFRPEGSDHRPKTQARLLYDDAGIFVFFRVEDRYVRAVAKKYQDMVCFDACVEFFVEPRPGTGYFNFEVNCGGTLHLSHIEDPTRTPEGFKKFAMVPKALGSQVKIFHSMPEIVDPEQTEPVVWVVEYFIPRSLFDEYWDGLGALSGQTWRANFYKCADETSRPHWAMWAPITGGLSFHTPEYFAPVRFE